MMPVAILAGGLAIRMRPITEKIPKALIDVAGEPFIFHQLRYLQKEGISRVVLCVGYLGEMIEAAVGDGSSFGISVVYSDDGPTLLGTGGSIKKALPLLGDHFFVLYGDSFLPVDFYPIERAFLENKKLGLMTILKNDNRWDRSNVLFKQGVLIEYNKHSPRSDMSFIDYGLGALSYHAIQSRSDEIFDLADLYHDLSMNGQLAGYEVFERFYEIGSLKGLQEAELFFKETGCKTRFRA